MVMLSWIKRAKRLGWYQISLEDVPGRTTLANSSTFSNVKCWTIEAEFTQEENGEGTVNHEVAVHK